VCVQFDIAFEGRWGGGQRDAAGVGVNLVRFYYSWAV
jgi:hypothetical protein